MKEGSLLRNLWTPEAMSKLRDCTAARLIPLNKVWPKIPGINDFRPIIVLSAIFKFLELRFLPKLQCYLSQKMDKCQTGFVPKLGTQINILELIKQIKYCISIRGT